MFPHHGESFGFRYHIINYCFISCNNALQKMLFLIGITCQMHVRESHITSAVIVNEALWTSGRTCLFVMQLDTGLFKPPSKMPISWKMWCVHLSYNSIAQHTLSSTVDVPGHSQWMCLGIQVSADCQCLSFRYQNLT